MKRLFLFITTILLSDLAFSQAYQPAGEKPGIKLCGQSEKMLELRQKYPGNVATTPSKDKYTPTSSEKSGTIYTIPVVFHIVHKNGPENISDAQIQDQLAILNRDFRRQNADANQVQAVFQGMPADIEIEFRFATVAPDGTCFNGITRTVDSLEYGEAVVQQVVDGNDVYQGIWPGDKYLNIFVQDDIGGAAGYAHLPNDYGAPGVESMFHKSIFILQDYTGSIGTSEVYHSRVLTHEAGHWLNLNHIWGEYTIPGGCGITTDSIQDTPSCIGTTSCSLNLNSCDDDDAYWGFPIRDNVENYMDYSYCSKMFTPGQAAWMRTAIMSPVGGRSNIWTDANLQETGVLPGSSLCQIDFTASQIAVCPGTAITYNANTAAGIATYSWTFPGGTPSSSTDANPTVTYAGTGTYNAELVVTSTANGASYTETKTSYITVGDAAPSFPAYGPYCSGATVPALPTTAANGIPGTWSPTAISNTASGTYTFTPSAGQCVTAGPHTLSITINPTPVATFGTLASMCANEDVIALTQGLPVGGAYSGAGVLAAHFNPGDAGIGAHTLTYTYTNTDGCSDTATATISVNQCLGMDESEGVSINVFPNPSSGKFKVVAEQDQIVMIRVVDYAGKLVMAKTINALSTEVDLGNQAAGVYYLELQTETIAHKVPVFVQK